MNKPLHPWSRVPGEGSKSYAYFQMYLELGVGRSVVKVSEKCSKSLSLLHRLSSRFNWLERAADYDNHQAELVSRQLAVRRANAQARQAERAAVLSDTAMVAARRLVGRLQADQNAELSPSEISQLFGTASKVEATALQFGADKMNVAVDVNVAASKRSEADMDDESAVKVALCFIDRWMERNPGRPLPLLHPGETTTKEQREAEIQRALLVAGKMQ